ncbi:MAG TPA: S24 family peptidase [Gammaproteobacteria bacterium]|nr:S24 family peptidase [Gammaproteobacteria bacterium]
MEARKVIKQTISKSNSAPLEDTQSNWTSLNMLSTISQSHAEQLRPTLSYKHLKNSCFLIRARFSRVIPFYVTRVAAGTPFNGEDYDYIEHLDLNEHLTGNSNNIFCIRVQGESMIGAGICDNDILVVDRSIQPTDGTIVIASLNSELTVKRLKHAGDQITLMPANADYSPIVVTEDIELKIWGVVIHVIHSLLTEEKKISVENATVE